MFFWRNNTEKQSKLGCEWALSHRDDVFSFFRLLSKRRQKWLLSVPKLFENLRKKCGAAGSLWKHLVVSIWGRDIHIMKAQDFVAWKKVHEGHCWFALPTEEPVHRREWQVVRRRRRHRSSSESEKRKTSFVECAGDLVQSERRQGESLEPRVRWRHQREKRVSEGRHCRFPCASRHHGHWGVVFGTLCRLFVSTCQGDRLDSSSRRSQVPRVEAGQKLIRGSISNGIHRFCPCSRQFSTPCSTVSLLRPRCKRSPSRTSIWSRSTCSFSTCTWLRFPFVVGR